ncbi:MAG: DUF2791 family P-loop domain-containing protein [Armatimonadetes bacterium]|nr:DUF2791 family P-loop domain-containing protein [Armatimonadota bacterium]
MIARSAIEALRSGVPSKHAVERLGITRSDVAELFERSLDLVADGQCAEPMVIDANFGAGKSHLLNYLQILAEKKNFATSYLTVSPEIPLGNPHVVLKALAENARAPGRTGKALRAMSPDLRTSGSAFADLRLWARDANIYDRFRALLHVFEETHDDELRMQILGDFEGKPLILTVLRQKLREMGQLAGYDLRGPRNFLLAHDRIRVMAQLLHACGCNGIVVLFDELERLAQFSRKQRFAAYDEVGWWIDIAAQSGSRIIPVFTLTRGFVEETITGGASDELRYFSGTLGILDAEPDNRGQRGIEFLKQPIHLSEPTTEEKEQVKYRIKAIYEEAYGLSLPDLKTLAASTTMRSDIRRWVTLWDMHRYYPQHDPDVDVGNIEFDTTEISDEDLPSGEEAGG